MNVTTLMLPTRVMPTQWFICNVQVKNLSINDKYINAIAPNAFNTPAFIGTLVIVKLYMPLAVRDLNKWYVQRFDIRIVVLPKEHSQFPY